VAKDFFETIVARAGFAGEFEALTETEIAGAVSGAYTPGEDGVWKIVASRVVQLLLGSPLHVRTFQTSAATLRMPSGSLPAASTDAQDGRFYFVKNDPTATGVINLQKSDGTALSVLVPGDFAVVAHGDADDWDVNLISPDPNELHFTIGGRLDIPSLPTTGLAMDAILVPGNVATFAARRMVAGTSGTTTIQLEQNGSPIGGATLSWTPSDAGGTLKTVTINVNLAINDTISLRITSAESKAADIIAVVS
jgi:hypothetical protein